MTMTMAFNFYMILIQQSLHSIRYDLSLHIGPEIELTFVFVIFLHDLHIAVKVKRRVFSLVQ